MKVCIPYTSLHRLNEELKPQDSYINWSKLGLKRTGYHIGFSKQFYVKDEKLFTLAVMKHQIEFTILQDD